MNEHRRRQHLVRLASHLSARGLSPGSSGNISVRTDDGFLMTPTKSRLGLLDPGRLCRLDPEGGHLDGDAPTKERWVHLAMYRARPDLGAVVHLHSPAAMALSCLKGIDPDSALPPLTPYFVMRIGALPLLPYFQPGDPALASAVADKARNSHALLLAHHGLIAGGKDLDDAVDNAEELEETARLYLSVRDRPHRILTPADISALDAAFPRNR